MEATSGQLVKLGPLLLCETRPVLIAVACRHFMERGKYPEVVKSCVFQIWRTQLARGRWKEDKTVSTDLAKGDAEGRTPLLPDSRTSAASFACLEALGVTPPPTGGWLPKDAKDERNSSKDLDRSPKREAEWWGNTENPEWIYHKDNDMYFHCPSNTMWEKHKMECYDLTARAPPHTYIRVDALHLQALRNFAASMDSAVLPTVFKAWVRAARKNTGPNVGDKGKAGRSPSRSPGRSSKERGSRLDETKKGAEEGEVALDGMQSDGVKAMQTSVNVAPMIPRAEASMAPSAFQGAMSMEAGPITPAPTVMRGVASMVQTPLAISEMSDDESGPGTKRRGCCLCLCGRGRRNNPKHEYGNTTSTASDTSVISPADPKGAAAAAKLNGQVSPKAGSPKTKTTPSSKADVERILSQDPETPAPDEAVKPSCDVAERHHRRLDMFLDEVKRNPQRLITHIDRRRAEKTHLAYIVL